MPCGFGMATDGPVARKCAYAKCDMWVATSKGKGQCVFLAIAKRLQYVGDMLSGIDDTLKAALELARHITEVKE